ncbi:unnamed protein product [Schistosoma mattheei]|uniref:Uncharacterized protein n=1 Tax=Schistosoma mattheei TaxID=31246 RepID=A0A183NPS2_9TREM|nr:unnamed protein product [Schistosoma mattheei]
MILINFENSISQNVRFVLTCDSKSSIARSLCNRIDCQLLTVSGLTTHERGAAVRSLLGKYGKVLSESGFRNQVCFNDLFCLKSILFQNNN